MIKIIVLKELRIYFTSPKFVAVFSICSFLILLSIFMGIQEYRAAISQYDTGVQLAVKDLQERNSWMGAGTRVFRKPDPMQIFVSGVSNDIGRLSAVNQEEQVKLRNSPYSDDPVFATFRYLDFSFIVQVILSLLAIMFTYDSINGEREEGTLKLIFSNAVPKVHFIAAKMIGSWFGLLIPVLIPVLLGILLLPAFNIPFSGDHWGKLSLLFGMTILYYTFFITAGVAVSAMTKSSSVSFMVLIVLWVFLVLIVPRAGVLTAANIIRVPGVAEIDARVEGFSAEQWKAQEKSMAEAWRARNAEMQGMDKDERKAYEDEHLWKWMEEDEARRKQMQTEITEYTHRIKEDVRNRRDEQQRLAFGISRISPAAAFRLAAMHLAGTGIDMKVRYENAIEEYKTILDNFIESKRSESNDPGGIRITFDSENGFSFQTADVKKMLDVSEMPQFSQPEILLPDAVPKIMKDLFLLLIACLVVFSLGWSAFLRCDLR